MLRKVNYGESDVIATLLTRDHGIVSVIARAARKSTKRFPGLQPLRPIQTTIRRKPNATMHTLHEAIVLSEYRGLEASLAKISTASYLTELTGSLLREGDPSESFFDALDGMYSEIANDTSSDEALVLLTSAFELRLLNLSGWAPRFDACFDCGLVSAEMESFRVVRSGEGLVCDGCRGGRRYGSISGDVLRWLHYLQSPMHHDAPNESPDFDTINRVVRASVDANVVKAVSYTHLTLPTTPYV